MVLIPVVIWSLLSVIRGQSLFYDLNLATNNQHTDGVNSIRYNPQTATVATASYDCRVGIWDPQLQPLASMPDPFYLTKASFNGGLFQIEAQVSNLQWGYHMGQHYVIINIMGNYLRVLKQDPSGRLIDHREMKPDSIFPSNSWSVIQGSSRLLVGNRKQDSEGRLIVYDFVSGDIKLQKDFDSRPHSFCVINTREMLMCLSKRLVLVSLDNYEIIDYQFLPSSPIYVEALNGQYSSGSTEVALSMPMASIDIYDHNQITLGRKRSFYRLHGFMESRALKSIPHTNWAISAAAAYTSFSGPGGPSLLIFDIRAGSATPVLNPKIFFSEDVNVGRGGEYVMEVDYIRNTNTFYFSIYGYGNSDRIFKAQYCEVDRCIECADPLSRSICTKCAISYSLVAPNECLDCSLIANKDRCDHSFPFDLVVIGKTSPDYTGTLMDESNSPINLQHTGALVEIIVQVQNDERTKFTYENLSPLSQKFSVSIVGLTKSVDYTYAFIVKQTKIYIAFNFTLDVDNKELKVSLYSSTLIEGDGYNQSLTLFNDTKTALISGDKITDPIIIGTVTQTAKVTGQVIAGALAATGVVAFGGLFCALGFSSPFFSFFQIIEVPAPNPDYHQVHADKRELR